MKLDPVDRLLKINEAMYYLLEEPPTPQKKVFGDPEVVARVTSNMQSSPSSSPAPTQSSAPKSGPDQLPASMRADPKVYSGFETGQSSKDPKTGVTSYKTADPKTGQTTMSSDPGTNKVFKDANGREYYWDTGGPNNNIRQVFVNKPTTTSSSAPPPTSAAPPRPSTSSTPRPSPQEEKRRGRSIYDEIAASAREGQNIKPESTEDFEKRNQENVNAAKEIGAYGESIQRRNDSVSAAFPAWSKPRTTSESPVVGQIRPGEAPRSTDGEIRRQIGTTEVHNPFLGKVSVPVTVGTGRFGLQPNDNNADVAERNRAQGLGMKPYGYRTNLYTGKPEEAYLHYSTPDKPEKPTTSTVVSTVAPNQNNQGSMFGRLYNNWMNLYNR